MALAYSPVYDENGHFVGVQDNNSGAIIPRDSANSDWQGFLGWNAAHGNPISLHDLPPTTPMGPRSISAIVVDLQNLSAQQRNTLLLYVTAWTLQNNPKMAIDLGLPVSGYGPQYFPAHRFQATTGFAVANS